MKTFAELQDFKVEDHLVGVQTLLVIHFQTLPAFITKTKQGPAQTGIENKELNK